jgi:hypothetical protein
VEASGLVRTAEAGGDFAAILRKGDADSGALLIVVRKRGELVACLERRLDPTGTYRWAEVSGDQAAREPNLAEFLDRRVKFDPDLWLIELDIAHPERFIAETTSAG